MSEAVYIELPPQTPKKRSILATWKGLVLLLLILAVVAAGCFSWWLGEGKVGSAYARVETVVFTVQTEVPAQVDMVLVREGEEVHSGQRLAVIDPTFGQKNAAAKVPALAGKSPDSEEKRISALLAALLEEEAKFRKIHQDRVTEHVRAQLALRSTDPAYIGAYEQASRMEQEARNRMNLARQDFEKISKQRAQLDLELSGIRYEIVRRKPQARKTRQEAQPEKAPAAPPSIPLEDSLYAPVSGRIMGVSAVAGQTVQRGQPLFMIMPSEDASNSWIQAWFPISAQQMLKVGQKATVKAGDRHLQGKVSAIAQEGQYLPNGRGQYTQYLPVQIMISDPEELARLTPGTSVECQIQTRYVPGWDLF